MNELVEVLSRPKFDLYTTRDDRRHFLELLGGVARIVPIVRHIRACREPKGDKFLDVALNGDIYPDTGGLERCRCIPVARQFSGTTKYVKHAKGVL